MSEWRPIKTRPKDDSQFLACTADGRVMIFNGVILDRILTEDDRAPKHLQFPATHWMPLPKPPQESPDAAAIARGWARAYREGPPEFRFPSDPNAEFFPRDMDFIADEIDRLRLVTK